MQRPTTDLLRHELRRFLLSFASVSGGNYAAIALSFLISVTLTRILGAEEFGRLALLLTISQVLVVLVSSWTLTGLVRFGAREYAASRSIAETFWSRATLLGPWLVAALTVLAISAGVLTANLQVPAHTMAVVALHIVGATIFSTAAGALQATGRMSGYGAALFAERALALVAVLVLHRVQGIDAVAALAIYATTNAFVATWALRSLGTRELTPVRVRRAAVLALWRFSLPLVASTWAGLLGTQWIDLAMIRIFLDLADVGRYAIASQVAGALMQLAIIMSTLLLPRYSVLAQRDPEALREEVDRVLPYWLLGFSLLAAVAVALAGIGVPLVFGPEFAAAVPALALLIVATSAGAIASTFQALLAAHGIMWPMTGAILASVATNVALNAYLIPRLGISGAALATVISYTVSAALMLSIARQRLRLPVLRYALFVSPAVSMYVLWLALRGAWFYGAALVVLAVGALLISRAFGLFRAAAIEAAVGTDSQ